MVKTAPRKPLGCPFHWAFTIHVDHADRSGDAQGLKNADLNPGWIELVPCQSMPLRSRVRVMIIVPTFSERDEGNPPVVTGIVPCQETARAPHVSHRVHHPRAMQTDHHAKANTPQEHGNPSKQIGCVLRHELGVIVLGLPDEKPGLFRFSWKWTRRSPCKVKERTHEEATPTRAQDYLFSGVRS